jgi:hypothetical protein
MTASNTVVFPILGEPEHDPLPTDFLPNHEVLGPAHGATHTEIISGFVRSRTSPQPYSHMALQTPPPHQ